MAPKRPKRPAKSSPADEAVASPPPKRSLLYKVVELSSVDEHSLERTINEWVPMGWKFDGVQFAMRESSKRPSMAYLFFTREGAPIVEQGHVPEIVPHLEGEPRGEAEALAHLQRLTREGDPMQTAWERLHGLAADKPVPEPDPEPEDS